MKHNNTYIFIYSSAMVLIVAAILSAFAYNLKPFQDKNREIEKKQDILKSVKISSTPTDAEGLYDKHLIEAFITNSKGEKVEFVTVMNKKYTAFDIDLKKEYKKNIEERNLPLYRLTKNDSTFLVIPLRGAGLWGPIWGYISVIEKETADGVQLNEVYGATFDHEGETPGLGAEISGDKFQKQFVGEEIFTEAGKLVGVKVVKGGAKPNDLHGVDAVTGGTITSNGVTAMLETCIDSYETYLTSQK